MTKSGTRGARTKMSEKGLPSVEVVFSLMMAMEEAMKSGRVKNNSLAPAERPRRKASDLVLVIWALWSRARA